MARARRRVLDVLLRKSANSIGSRMKLVAAHARRVRSFCYVKWILSVIREMKKQYLHEARVRTCNIKDCCEPYDRAADHVLVGQMR